MGAIGPAIVYPKRPKDKASIQAIRDLLVQQQQYFHEARSNALGFTAFFWIGFAEQPELDALNNLEQVSSRLAPLFSACSVRKLTGRASISR